MFETIFQFITEFIESQSTSLGVSIFGYVVLFILFLAFKATHIANFFERFKYLKFQRFEKVLNNEVFKVDSEESSIKKYLKKQAEVEAFNYSNKVNWNREFQILALDIYNGSLNIDINKIKRAYIFLEVVDGRIKVQISLFEWLFLHLMSFLGGIAVIIGSLLVSLSILSLGFDQTDEASRDLWFAIVKYIFRILSSMIFLLSGVFLIENQKSLKYAKEIDKYLISNNSNYESDISHLPESKSVIRVYFLVLAIFIL